MMKKLAVWLLMLCMSVFLNGCYFDYNLNEPENSNSNSLIIFTDPVIDAETEILIDPTTQTVEVTEEETSPEITETQDFETPEDEPLPASVEKDGSYTSPEDVAEYIHTFGTLPSNFITKKEAQNLGWNSSQGNLQEVAPGMSIGGDTFGNREGLLPEGSYHECDVNYSGGYRGAERLIYSDTGEIYYTDDHYQSFTQLY